MISFLLAAALLGQPKPAVADAPKSVITLSDGKPVPAKVEANRTLFLSAKKSTKDAECIVKWIVYPPSLLENPDNFNKYPPNDFVLNVGPTEQQIMIGAAVASGKQVDVMAVTIIVGKGPRPPPDPTPDPIPPPVVDFLGFAAMAKTEAAKLPATNRRQAAKLADNFDAIGGRLAAGGLKTPEAANKELKSMHLETLGGDRAIWLPWFTAWAKIADKGNNDGTLSTNEHYVKAYQATAAGLRGVN